MRRPVLALGALALLLGPALALRGQGRREQPHGNLKIECNECHSPERWVPVDKPPTFRHARTGFELEGAHRQASCKACHRTLVFERVGTSCVDCHKDAHRGEMGPHCESCHTPSTWQNQPSMFRAHSRSRFPMMSVHARLDCAACHRNQTPNQYATTPAECGNCHYSTFTQTVSPNHVQAGFSRRCQDCHNVTSNSWHEATFTHPSSFPLSGGHGGVTCSRCHTGGTTGPMPTTCVSCHRKDFESTTNPNHPGGGFPVTCEDCHTIVTWRPAKFDHDKTAFPLTGAHTRTDCAKCHVGGRYKGTPKDCYSCHKPNYDATSSPNHRSAGFPTQCQNCHNTGAWKPANFDHNSTRFPLTGAHQKAECTKCHIGGNFTKLPIDCYSCHQQNYAATTNPNHPASNFPKECQTCHSTVAWRPASVDHNKTRFPLTGAHQRTDCVKCHVGGRYTGTPTDCWSCHQTNYNQTTNPNHVASNFPKTCQACHSTSAWRPASVDHNATRFPLTGAHTKVDCAKCHVGGRYTGTPTDCWSCHQTNYNQTTNPNHVASNFPKTCQTCHSTAAWRPATVDHNATRFPLTGAHTKVDCAKCHVGGRYTGTPTDCYACHQANYAGTTNPNHAAAQFPTQCATCHTTTAWKPATFDHDGPYFPIYSGKHKGQWTTCGDCHVNAANYKVFECILCHQHSNKTQVDSNHKGVSGYVYASSACYQCHRNGRAGAFHAPRRLP